MLVGPATSLGAPSVTGEFDLPTFNDGMAGVPTTVGANSELAAGPDGNIWVAVEQNTVVRVRPDGSAESFQMPGMTAPATGIIAGPDGNLWGAQGTSVIRIPPANPAAADQTAITGLTAGQGITVGPDGNIWVAGNQALVRIPPANPAGYELFPDTDIGSNPKGMTTASDGTMWVADGNEFVTSASAADPPITTNVNVGIATGGTQDVGGGPNGQIAYANPVDTPQNIGLVPGVGGTPQKIELLNTDPFGVTFGQDGAYWISRFQGNDLVRLATGGQVTMLGGFSALAGPRKITTGPGNTLWTTLDLAEKIGRVSGVEPPPGGGPGPGPGTAPETKIDKGPKRKVKIAKSKRRAKVKLKFSSTAGATFECTLTRKGKKPKSGACTSPKKYKLKQGRYKFSVVATVAGVTGPAAAQKFKIVRAK